MQGSCNIQGTGLVRKAVFIYNHDRQLSINACTSSSKFNVTNNNYNKQIAYINFNKIINPGSKIQWFCKTKVSIILPLKSSTSSLFQHTGYFSNCSPANKWMGTMSSHFLSMYHIHNLHKQAQAHQLTKIEQY